MSIDPSLKIKNALTRHRNVLRRAERIEQLKDEAFAGALMNRDAWERWLENNPPGGTASASAAGSAP